MSSSADEIIDLLQAKLRISDDNETNISYPDKIISGDCMESEKEACEVHVEHDVNGPKIKSRPTDPLCTFSGQSTYEERQSKRKETELFAEDGQETASMLSFHKTNYYPQTGLISPKRKTVDRNANTGNKIGKPTSIKTGRKTGRRLEDCYQWNENNSDPNECGSLRKLPEEDTDWFDSCKNSMSSWSIMSTEIEPACSNFKIPNSFQEYKIDPQIIPNISRVNQKEHAVIYVSNYQKVHDNFKISKPIDFCETNKLSLPQTTSGDFGETDKRTIKELECSPYELIEVISRKNIPRPGCKFDHNLRHLPKIVINSCPTSPEYKEKEHDILCSAPSESIEKDVPRNDQNTVCHAVAAAMCPAPSESNEKEVPRNDQSTVCHAVAAAMCLADHKQFSINEDGNPCLASPRNLKQKEQSRLCLESPEDQIKLHMSKTKLGSSGLPEIHSLVDNTIIARKRSANAGEKILRKSDNKRIRRNSDTVKETRRETKTHNRKRRQSVLNSIHTSDNDVDSEIKREKNAASNKENES